MRKVEEAFDAIRDELTLVKVEALGKHNNQKDAVQSFYDQACVLLSKKLDKELDQTEQMYVRRRCLINKV